MCPVLVLINHRRSGRCSLVPVALVSTESEFDGRSTDFDEEQLPIQEVVRQLQQEIAPYSKYLVTLMVAPP